MTNINITQKRIYELPQTFIPTDIGQLANKFLAVDQLGWGEARKVPMIALFSALGGVTGDMIGLLAQLAFASNNQSRAGAVTVNTGTTAITFDTAFDEAILEVIVLAEARRISDNAVIDYVVGAATISGFDLTVWEDAVSVRYVALPAAMPVIDSPVVPGVQFTQNESVTIANTTVESSFIGDGVGTANLSSLFFDSGRTVRIVLSGYMSATNGDTATVRIKLGTTNIVVSTESMPSTFTNKLFFIEFMLTCQTTGVTGTVIGQGRSIIHAGVGLSTPTVRSLPMIAPFTIDTTEGYDIGVTYQWGTARVGNTITATNCVIEILN
jgi:hypothetical protein